jgi:hypothetical protein
VSENTARLEESHPERTKKWEGQEFIDEFEFLVRNGLNVVEAVESLGRDVKGIKSYFRSKGREDLAKYL